MEVFTAEQAAERYPFCRGKGGRLLYKFGMNLTGFSNINQIHDAVDKAGIPYGPDFAKGILDKMGVDMLIGNAERLEPLQEGPFIAIANHVYGHMDGIVLVDVLGHLRPRVKLLANEMLMYIKGLTPNLIAVNPTVTKDRTTATSINGIKEALRQLRDGEPVAMFPSGAVADLKPFKHWSLEEREWQDGAIRLIRKAKVPVVPIKFFDHNSWFYYSLGLIDFRIRFLRLFHEVRNKKGQTHRMGIGEIITPEQQAAVSEAEFKAFLRSSVYDMPLPETFVKRSDLWK